MTSGLGLYLGHLGSETRSLGQIIEKPCEDNRGHSFHQILMKYGQNVCLVKIWARIEFGSSRVKNKVTRSKFKKKTCVDRRDHSFHPILIKL